MESERNLYRSEISRLKTNIDRIDRETGETLLKYKFLSQYLDNDSNRVVPK